MADSKLAIYGAIAADVAIAITKFVVAGITGSSAMLSEGIHSDPDTFNGVLLSIGLRLSQWPATPEHPFGHGKELYFWRAAGTRALPHDQAAVHRGRRGTGTGTLDPAGRDAGAERCMSG